MNRKLVNSKLDKYRERGKGTYTFCQVGCDCNIAVNLLEKCENLQSKIDKAIEYYETHQQECVIGRNKDDKLIKDYYLPAQCSKKLYEFLKEAENVENN